MKPHTARARWSAAIILSIIAISPRLAFAQQPTPNTNLKSPATGKNLEITVGGVFLTPTSMGTQDIALIAPNGSPLVLAGTTSGTAPSFGVEARLGFRASDRMRIEINGGWSHVSFQTEVSGDTENTSSLTASLPVHRFTAGGAATFRLTQKGKREFYAIGGASWMRELSELSAVGVYDDGAIVDGGGGIKVWWKEGSTGRVKRVGLRVEGRVGVRMGGLTLDDKSVHFLPTIIGSLIIGS